MSYKVVKNKLKKYKNKLKKLQIMKVKDLKPHPLNPKLNPIDKNEEERKDLAKRLEIYVDEDNYYSISTKCLYTYIKSLAR